MLEMGLSVGGSTTPHCMLIDNNLMDMKQSIEITEVTCNEKEKERKERTKDEKYVNVL
mgnify:CR=1 FL=1